MDGEERHRGKSGASAGEKGKVTLTAQEFRDPYEWLEEEDTRLVRKSLVRARKQAPVFALGDGLGFKLRKLTIEEEDKLSGTHARKMRPKQTSRKVLPMR